MGEFYTSKREMKANTAKDIKTTKNKNQNSKHKNNKHKNTKETFSSRVLRENFGALGEIPGILEDIGVAVIAIGNFFIGLTDFFLWAGEFIKFLIVDVLNPVNLISDIVDMSIPKTIISIIVQTIIKMFRYLVNELLNPVIKKIFGWDTRSAEPDGNDQKTKKCFKSSDVRSNRNIKNIDGKNDGEDITFEEEVKNTVPLNVLIATIILPPLGVFMKFGLVNWVNILITGTLTMLFYLPGLIYALVLLYT